MNRESYGDYMVRRMKEERPTSLQDFYSNKEDLYKRDAAEMQKTLYWCYNRIRELNEEIYRMRAVLDSYQRAKNDLRQMEFKF